MMNNNVLNEQLTTNTNYPGFIEPIYETASSCKVLASHLALSGKPGTNVSVVHFKPQLSWSVAGFNAMSGPLSYNGCLMQHVAAMSYQDFSNRSSTTEPACCTTALQRLSAVSSLKNVASLNVCLFLLH